MPIEIRFQPNDITQALITGFAARKEAERETATKEAEFEAAFGARLGRAASRGVEGGLNRAFEEKEAEKDREHKSEEAGKTRKAKSEEKERARGDKTAELERANDFKQESATTLYERRRDLQRERNDDSLVMKALTQGVLQDTHKVGFTPTQMENIASLQNARNVVTAGAAGDGGFILNPRQAELARDRIDDELDGIRPGLIELSPDEIAQRQRPTVATEMEGTVKVDGVTMGLDRNGTLKAVNDPTQERSAVLKTAKEAVAAFPSEGDEEGGELTLEEYNRRSEAQFAHDWAIVTGDALKPPIAEPDPADPSQAPTGLGDSPDLGPPHILPFPNVNDPGFDPSQLEIGQAYEATGPNGESIVGVWTGDGLDPDLDRGVRAARANLEQALKSAEGK